MCGRTGADTVALVAHSAVHPDLQRPPGVGFSIMEIRFVSLETKPTSSRNTWNTKTIRYMISPSRGGPFFTGSVA